MSLLGAALGDDLYISAVATTDSDDGMLRSTVYVIDGSSDELRTIAVPPYRAQYPLAVFDESTGLVYYANNVDGGDQLFQYDPKSQKTKQLTSDFYAINYILPIPEDVAVVAAPRAGGPGDHSLLAYEYQRKTGTTKQLSKDLDFTISAAAYTGPKFAFKFAGYSSDGMYDLLDQQDGSGDMPCIEASSTQIEGGALRWMSPIEEKLEPGGMMSICGDDRGFCYLFANAGESTDAMEPRVFEISGNGVEPEPSVWSAIESFAGSVPFDSVTYIWRDPDAQGEVDIVYVGDTDDGTHSGIYLYRSARGESEPLIEIGRAGAKMNSACLLTKRRQDDGKNPFTFLTDEYMAG